jgi:transposase, IS30 family
MKEYTHLTALERAEIARMKTHRLSQRAMAEELRRAPSTIGREVRRNGSKRWGYRADEAQRQALRRRRSARKPQRMKEEALRQEVEGRILEDWAPEQIAGYRKRHGQPGISRETIYRHVREQPALRIHLRGWGRRKSRRNRPYERIYNRTMIDQRPVEANERMEAGHWECDTVRGAFRSSIGLATLADRKTRYVLIHKVKDRSARTWNDGARERLKGFPVKSLTVDNGMEFGSHEALSTQLCAPVFFAHACCPWERGTNENHNRLIRQYVPKGMDMEGLSEEHIRWIEERINNRPRKGLGYCSPAELMMGAKNFCPPRGAMPEELQPQP